MSNDIEQISLITWRRVDTKQSLVADGVVGKYMFFSIVLDAWRPKGSKIPPYRLTCRLPGIRTDVGNFDSELAARHKADQILAVWLTGSGLEKTK